MDSRTTIARAGRILYWTLPAVFCLALYGRGLRAWFLFDDFAWLGLGVDLHTPRDLLAALFSPMAQGTVRPLSERAFFLLLNAVFGMRPAPYHACVFLTQFASLALLSWVARRLTGSALVGFLAPVLWTANAVLVLPLTWTSAFNQVLCGCLLLAAFGCLLRYIETGKRAWLAGQWAAFLLGLGALELAAVYPALAAAYCLCRSRRHLLSTLPLAVVSAAYLGLHLFLVPRPADPVLYALDFGPSMGHALAAYWLGALALHQGLTPLTAALSLGLLGFAAWQIFRGKLLAAFLLWWFLALIAPVLPLKNHFSDYYMALPAMGTAVLGAWAIGAGLSSGRARGAAALVLGTLFLANDARQAYLGTAAIAERSFRARTLVYGAARARLAHPDQTIVLTGVGEQLYRDSVKHFPFRPLGLGGIFLAPDEVTGVPPEELSQVTVPPGVLLDAIEQGRARVYAVENRRLRATTWTYLEEARRRWQPEPSRRIDAAQAVFAAQLGPGWYAADGNHRWMGRRAVVWLAGPRKEGAQLVLAGSCRQAPLALRLSLAGQPLPELQVLKGGSNFRFVLPLPRGLAGHPRLELTLEVNRTFHVPGDERELGLAFGTFEIREAARR